MNEKNAGETRTEGTVTPGAEGVSREMTGAERLHSWKEIAAYLRHGLRTVQRWEQAEGLPVHRHAHEKRDAVYAYPEELDAWWSSRRARLDREEEYIPVEMLVGKPPLSRRIAIEKRIRRAAWVIAALLAIAAFAIWMSRHL